MANSGRPKKDDCNNIIKVSVNDETASMLDTAASWEYPKVCVNLQNIA